MDQVLYWNAVALESDRVAHTDIKPLERGTRGPAGSSRALGIVHLAMHDAFFSIAGAPHGCWLTAPPVAANGSKVEAAIAVAAHTTLTALYPAQTARLDRALRESGLHGPGTGRGSAHGQAIARAVLKARRGDPSLDDIDYAADTSPPNHRPDPVNPKQGYYAPHYGARSHCFAVTSRYSLDPPPKTNDPRYLAALREVRGKGVAPESAAGLPPGLRTRTAAETLAAVFWAFDGAKRIGTPPRLYNRIVREIAGARGNSVEQNARLFALVNTALADAAILCWDEKYRHNLWRPILGIREHDPSMGPAGTPGSGLDPECDPWWQPYGAPRSNEIAPNATPPFPAYPSGHATLGAAALQMTRRFYGVAADGPDSVTAGMAFVSDELDGETTDNHGVQRPRHRREFPAGLWQMIEENGRSRVFLGVHWSFDAFATDPSGAMDLSQNIGGARLGRDIADDLWLHGLKQAAAAGPRVP
ncbi:vanadium-dependent haloperoxidase [Nocardia huaxiensis]|uniref:Chloroperoxidase n=1 Tax=Nocardia huaxiensis TaxID=2755382 RepID=A0A7D6VCX7_9NOCA|nr:vanadium-dependent haloperoxidase [Nocardia huaxiensis]QLY32434.1 chloroperoxidase [Nocardia huaxiensis]UFS93860.1 hypothetical protein LPY97_24090 [Nocardia huaxiensis]